MVKENMDLLEKLDPEVGRAVKAEYNRQMRGLELIASENVVSRGVLAANSTVLTNKYAEGYPAGRYYGGCECVDVVENIAIERAKKLFGASYVNVQPHSGSQANIAVYFALIKPGDSVLGMSLADGGHLTHGSPVNFSGKVYNFESYSVCPDTGLINYDEIEEKVKTHKPKLVVAGASAYPRIIDFERIAKIAHDGGALFMVDMAHIAGLVAAGLHPSPLPFADVVTTTTHKTLRGPRGGLILTNNEEIAKLIKKSIFPGTQGGPLMHTIAAKAVCFGEALTDEFKDYQRLIVKNAKALASGLIGEGFELVSGGTDNHLMLLDLRNTKITGKELEERLDKVYITVNKNSVPNDPQRPSVTSGVRIGTPSVTTRGLNEDDMKTLSHLIALTAFDFENSQDHIRAEVTKICEKYPLYAE